MARINSNLLQLDIDQLFEEHKIEDIIEIEKLLDAEIERKRVDLRSMVGDRYKDVLAASDAIKNMKTISQEIVDNIQNITNVCENLIISSPKQTNSALKVEKHSHEERVLIIQIRLAIVINEKIWIALDHEDNLTAAQFYLLAQHVHMGLSLSKQEYLIKLPLLKQIRTNLQTIRDQIFQRIKQKLESVEINASETSSNLNALLLLQNQSTNDLLNIFISHRKTALNTVMNMSHVSVRVQISAMVRCLITTVHLLHDCFMSCGNDKKGLIWQQLEEIVKDSAAFTISKIELPITPLNMYIPDIIKQFRPKYKNDLGEPIKETVALENWLESTKVSVKEGLENSLKLVTNVKGLHLIREEALKIELPSNWQEICFESKLPENFNVWYYFFQSLMTARVRELISNRVSSNFKDLQKDITKVLKKNEKAERLETDLRWYTWVEDSTDVSRVENKHTGLTMKTLGYSENIVNLCNKLDSKYLELLIDTSQYLYGREFDQNLKNMSVSFADPKLKKKFIDKEELEEHLRNESSKISTVLTEFLSNFLNSEKKSYGFVLKSLICARFLQAIPIQCLNFNKCCTFNGSTENWTGICGHFQKTSLKFWENWVEECVRNVEKEAKQQFCEIDVCSMISILPRWDTIEIQEQTEEKVFKSQIKVPLKPSLALNNILNKLNDEFSIILPQTLPKKIHLQIIEKCTSKILEQYDSLLEREMNQNQSLQYLFDMKFLTTFCILRENSYLINISQQVCDKLRAKIDPFDLDVFYSHLQNNVKRAVAQSQVIFGCLLPSSGQLASLGIAEKTKDQDREPSILALSTPSANTWFSLLPISVPSQKHVAPSIPQTVKVTQSENVKTTPKKSQDPAAVMRSSAAALFGGLTTDWFT